MQGVVFDFDGLILDTETPDYEAWKSVYAQHGATLDWDEWVASIGGGHGAFDPYTDLPAKLGRPIDVDAVRAERRRIGWTHIEQETIRPGVLDRLAEADALGLRIGCASSSPIDWVTSNMDRLGIRTRFHTITCGDEVEHLKPAPDVYLLAAERLGVAPAQCIVYEDSARGIVAANAAGMVTVAVPNTMTAGLDFSHADLRLDSLADRTLAAIWQQVTGNGEG